MPEITGNEPFTIEVDLYNDGKVDATVQFGVQSSRLRRFANGHDTAVEDETLYYSQQISKNVTYTFTFAGITKRLLTTNGILWSWGIGTVRNGGSGLGVFPEGSVSVPVILYQHRTVG